MGTLPAVIFDLDDTLYPERQYVGSGFRAAAEWASAYLRIPPDEGFRELQTLFEQGVRGDTFDQWLRARGIEHVGHVESLVRAYRGHAPFISPYDDVRPVIEALRCQAHVGLVTDGQREIQDRKLDALGVRDLFDAIVISDELGRHAWKPSPIPFRAALAMIGVEAAAATYVADNPAKDFIGARAVGIATVRIRRPDGLYSHLEPASPDHSADAEVSRLDHLDATLRRVRQTAPVTTIEFCDDDGCAE